VIVFPASRKFLCPPPAGAAAAARCLVGPPLGVVVVIVNMLSYGFAQPGVVQYATDGMDHLRLLRRVWSLIHSVAGSPVLCPPPPAAGGAADARCLVGTPSGSWSCCSWFFMLRCRFTQPGVRSTPCTDLCLQLSESGRHRVEEGLDIVIPPTYLSGATLAHPLCLVCVCENLYCEGGPPGWC
jgi:hypothetical protein